MLSRGGLTIALRDWITIYPSDYTNNPLKTSSITLIRADVSSDSWNQLEFPSSDVTVTQVNGPWGKITIFNIYNDGANDETIRLLMEFHHRNLASLE